MYETYYEAKKAYDLAVNNKHTEELQEKACKDPWYAYFYAIDVVGADIKYCQKLACKDPECAYYFAIDIEGANIEYCQKMACKKPQCAYCFARDVKCADFGVCLEVVKGTEWEDAVRKLVIEGVVG